jgi:hypothetical protein
MKTKIKGRLPLATCLSVSALVLCTSTPGWADNPYRRGHREPGSFANQHRGAAHNQQREAYKRAQEERLAKKVRANTLAQEARKDAQKPEADRRGHLNDHQVQSDGANVRHPGHPEKGVDQKGGIFDNVRRDNSEVQRNVGTPRRDPNQGQQPQWNIPEKREQPQQQLDKEAQRQSRFAEFDEKYRAICARTNKPDCTPPSHPTGRGTSSYEDFVSGAS